MILVDANVLIQAVNADRPHLAESEPPARPAGVGGGNPTTDARNAAPAVEHGRTVYRAGDDQERAVGIRRVDPLVG